MNFAAEKKKKQNKTATKNKNKNNQQNIPLDKIIFLGLNL